MSCSPSRMRTSVSPVLMAISSGTMPDDSTRGCDSDCQRLPGVGRPSYLGMSARSLGSASRGMHGTLRANHGEAGSDGRGSVHPWVENPGGDGRRYGAGRTVGPGSCISRYRLLDDPRAAKSREALGDPVPEANGTSGRRSRLLSFKGISSRSRRRRWWGASLFSKRLASVCDPARRRFLSGAKYSNRLELAKHDRSLLPRPVPPRHPEDIAAPQYVARHRGIR